MKSIRDSTAIQIFATTLTYLRLILNMSFKFEIRIYHTFKYARSKSKQYYYVQDSTNKEDFVLSLKIPNVFIVEHCMIFDFSIMKQRIKLMINLLIEL